MTFATNLLSFLYQNKANFGYYLYCEGFKESEEYVSNQDESDYIFEDDHRRTTLSEVSRAFDPNAPIVITIWERRLGFESDLESIYQAALQLDCLSSANANRHENGLVSIGLSISNTNGSGEYQYILNNIAKL